MISEETRKYMSELGKRSWAKRVEKLGEEEAKKLLHKAQVKGALANKKKWEEKTWQHT